VTLYLIFGSPFILAIPALFVANLSPLLFSIVTAIKIRGWQLIQVLLFTFIIIYLFSWISILWLPELYVQGSPLDPSPTATVIIKYFICYFSYCVF
jgi:hypothetical protein